MKPELNKVLYEISKEINIKHKGIKLIYLDADFPFINKFPLLPYFIEPHLKTRMNLNESRIRYRGCKAVRHDDHIHIQLR